MFVQVIQGQVSDAGQARAAMDRWTKELAPGAEGWLGSTAGVTEEGWLVALARFESEEAAQRNSDRPEQDAWWSETATLFTGPVAFQNSLAGLLAKCDPRAPPPADLALWNDARPVGQEAW